MGYVGGLASIVFQQKESWEQSFLQICKRQMFSLLFADIMANLPASFRLKPKSTFSQQPSQVTFPPVAACLIGVPLWPFVLRHTEFVSESFWDIASCEVAGHELGISQCPTIIHLLIAFYGKAPPEDLFPFRLMHNPK